MCLKVYHCSQCKMDYSRNLIDQSTRPFQLINSTHSFGPNLTQSFRQSLSQSSSLIVRLARFAFDFYLSTMDLTFLIQFFSFNFYEVNLELNLNRPNADDRNENAKCNEENQQVDEFERNCKIPFTPSIDKPTDELPDIIASHQTSCKQSLKNEELIDIGRKLRFIAEQFEKQRSK